MKCLFCYYRQMRSLIVNADDFGYSLGVNQGIIKAHTDGIVTSTSVMIDSMGAHEASRLSQYSALSVGLHFVVSDFEDVTSELERQHKKFISIVGSPPDHLNSHKIYTEDPRVYKELAAFAQHMQIPLRRFNPAKFIDSYFGPHAGGDVSAASLKRAIDQATDEFNEIMCHVGYCDEYLRAHSSYSEMREKELAAICDPSIKAYLKQNDIQLANWRSVLI